MKNNIKISVSNLSKCFMRIQRTKSKGITTDGLVSFIYLLKNTLRISPRSTKISQNNLFYALSDVSFEVAAGEVVGIIGRNGAGKSTLLKILARVLDPSSGSVNIHGRVMSMLELGIGFAPELSVRENIQIQGRLSGISPKQIQQVENDILEFAGLTQFRDTPLGNCPSGSFAQLGFASMINFKVDIILADEVLAVGDTRFRQACEERVKAAGKSGESVLFVSHDMNAIKRICTRVIWIDKGKIVRVGPTEEVVNAYTAELLAGRLLPPINENGLANCCRLLDFRLLDASRAQVGAMQITEDGYIDCLFRISRPDIAVTIQIELWQYKHCVLSTEMQRAISAGKTGTFRVGLKIPGNLLNELPYQAKCKLIVSSLTDTHLAPIIAAEDKLDILVMNSRPEDSVWSSWPWGRPGLISPRIEWSIDLNSDVGQS